MDMLFGIGHKARNGKDEAGKYLQEKYEFKVFHFGDALKSEAQDIGWKPENKNIRAVEFLEDLKQRVRNEKDVTKEILQVLKWYETHTNIDPDETFLQWYGTSYRRAQDDNYWINKTINEIRRCAKEQKLEKGFARVAICDMRFVNELIAVKQLNGLTFDVLRLDENGQRYIDPDRDPNHPSEAELDAIPHDFAVSSRSLEKMFAQLDNIILYITKFYVSQGE